MFCQVHLEMIKEYALLELDYTKSINQLIFGSHPFCYVTRQQYRLIKHCYNPIRHP